MAAVFRWGVLGVGKISADFCTALVQIPDAVVSAVAASSASNGRAEAFASQFSAKQPDIPIVACASYADLVGREDVDVVYIGNINTAHFETAMLAINAGKAVVVEKPVGVNGAEASALAAAAQAKGVFFMEGMWSRFLPAHRKAHELMSSGALGTIVAVHADFGFKCDDAPTTRMFDRNLAGGGLLDIGIYPLAVASMAFGGSMPSTIKATGTTHSTTGVDTSAGVVMVYGNNEEASGEGNAGGPAPGLAVITYNLRAFTPEEVVIAGTKARLVIKGPAHVGTKLQLTTPNGRSGIDVKEFDLPLPPPDASFDYNYPGSEGFCYEITEVHRCLAAKLKESPLYPHSEMCHIALTMDAIRAELGVTFPADDNKPSVAKKQKA